jgi:hypothetical protein
MTPPVRPFATRMLYITVSRALPSRPNFTAREMFRFFSLLLLLNGLGNKRTEYDRYAVLPGGSKSPLPNRFHNLLVQRWGERVKNPHLRWQSFFTDHYIHDDCPLDPAVIARAKRYAEPTRRLDIGHGGNLPGCGLTAGGRGEDATGPKAIAGCPQGRQPARLPASSRTQV